MLNLKKFLVKKLIEINQQLVIDTAIKNCHVTGLHSFIINENPKIRLFLADKTCSLRLPFDFKKPYLTIHPHKHNDLFIPLTKSKIFHHIYKLVEYTTENSISLETNMYNRLDIKKENMKGTCGGSDWLEYIGPTQKTFLKSNELHTVSIFGLDKCAWIIIEIGADEDFYQISYGGEQITLDCYQTFTNPIEYIKDFLEIK